MNSESPIGQGDGEAHLCDALGRAASAGTLGSSEMTAPIPAEFDAETRFRIRAERGAGKEAESLALLKKARGR